MTTAEITTIATKASAISALGDGAGLCLVGHTDCELGAIVLPFDCHARLTVPRQNRRKIANFGLIGGSASAPWRADFLPCKSGRFVTIACYHAACARKS